MCSSVWTNVHYVGTILWKNISRNRIINASKCEKFDISGAQFQSQIQTLTSGGVSILPPTTNKPKPLLLVFISMIVSLLEFMGATDGSAGGASGSFGFSGSSVQFNAIVVIISILRHV